MLLKQHKAKPSTISIDLQVLLIPNKTGYPCYHSLIQANFMICTVATLYHSLTISRFQDQFPLELLSQSNPVKLILSRTSALKNDIISNQKQLKLCDYKASDTCMHTIQLPCYFIFFMLFQLNSNFTLTSLMGNLRVILLINLYMYLCIYFP